MTPSDDELTRWVAGTKIILLRRLRRWNQAALGEAAGMDPSQISRYETGDELPRSQTLERLARSARVGAGTLSLMDEFLWTLARTAPEEAPMPAQLPERDPEGLSKVQARLSEALERTVSQLFLEFSWEAPSQNRAEALWERLKRYGPAAQRLLVEGADIYRDWRLCVLVCTESERVAAHRPSDAIELACLAIYIAEHVPGSERWCSSLQGYAWIFLGNARRVANTLAAANAAFTEGWRLWQKGEDSQGLLDQGYLLDLEASLRREERRFNEAVELHNRSLESARPEARGSILLNKAFTLQQAEKPEEALRALDAASQLIDEAREPRVFFGLQFNRAVNLLRIGRAREAACLIRQARGLAERLGNDLDRIRSRWLEGRLAAELEEWSEASELLEGVRAYFAERRLPYDSALVSLDLALVYGKLSRFQEIEIIASETLHVFREQGIGREALAAVILFTEAAEKREISTELMERIRERLTRAQQEMRGSAATALSH